MGKITVTLSDDTERQLRRYVTQTYAEKPFGKISEIVEEAVRSFLSDRVKRKL
jgi:Arc/MetJ-type ribon-helix-helix transcriptional regulator